jgi:hypothetical protein
VTTLSELIHTAEAALVALAESGLVLDGDRLSLTLDGLGELNVHGLTAAQLFAVKRWRPNVTEVHTASVRWYVARLEDATVCFFAHRDEWAALDQHSRVVAAPGPGSLMVAPDEPA